MDNASFLYKQKKENESLFKLWKEEIYDDYCLTMNEKDNEKIDIVLSDLIQLTEDSKTIGFYESLIKNKKFIGKQKKYFYDTLRINFGMWNEKNYDKINVIFE
jgi:hypothetical protein